MATATDTLLTAEEYGRLPDNGQRTELVRGRIVTLNMPYPRHGEICANIVYLLRRFLEDHDIGRVVGNDSGTITERGPDTVRGMDVGYYSYNRVPKGRLPRQYLDVSPELVFEVRSPTERWTRVHTKVAEYLTAGVTAICVVDEQTENATIYRGDQPPQVLNAADDFTLPDILPDFRVPVRRFFE
jgi:Uma2 family endonuclease